MKTVLLVGTADTKADELAFMSACLREQGVSVKLMDVGVLESTAFVRLGSSHGEASIEVGMIEKVAIANHEVAQAGGLHLDAVRRSTNENAAMQIMAKGAATLAAQAYARGDIHGLLALGGTMGTDLALDVAQSLPIGVPKLVLSTVAHSHLIAPERIAPDLITMLWAGGLYGLNELCKSALAQAAGACAGAVKAARPLDEKRPLIGMTSLGTSCLSYVVRLKPALEARGFEVAVFHSTGMGGRAFEALAAQGRFVAVLDLCLQELANHVGGSCVTSGPERLLSAGKAGIPQIVAPGAADMIDFAAWQPLPAVLAGRPVHEHNRLIASATSGPELRDLVARDIIQRLAQAKGPTHFVLPSRGMQAWDLPGQALYDEEGLRDFNQSLQKYYNLLPDVLRAGFRFERLDCHINDQAFDAHVLAVLDAWISQGVVSVTSKSVGRELAQK